MRILVTGGSGFIGRNLTKRLLKDGHEVTITSTGSEPKIQGIHKTLYMSLDGIDWDKINNTDVVFHLMANNDTQCQDCDEMFRANISGPIKLFAKARQGGCKKFIYASSTAVYGNSPAPYSEDTLIDPLNPYAKSKIEFDKFAEHFAKTSDVSVIGLRYCNVYGPGEEQKGNRMSMIGQMLRKIIAGKEIVLFKDGEQKRDWVYVDDVVQANMISMKKMENAERMFQIYNIGSGSSITFNKLAAEISSIVQGPMGDSRHLPRYIDCPFVDEYQNHTECNIEKARRDLGYSPSFDIRSGITEYFKNFS